MDVVTPPEELGLSAERLERIIPWMQGYVDAGKLPGAMTLVARQGKVAFLESVGFRDIEAPRPLTEDSILRIYSMSKPVTAAAVMMLYEEGHFQLDDPVAEFIPDFKEMRVLLPGTGADMGAEPARNPITIHHLLT
ncbi:MAG: beta-lactamase family protein, partial [Desulfobacterales bacterium]|nr:beta-lactamase family protein [Desulfobacterales bacterium]